MKEEYRTPWTEVLELKTECVLCTSFTDDGAVIDKITIDENYQW